MKIDIGMKWGISRERRGAEGGFNLCLFPSVIYGYFLRSLIAAATRCAPAI